MACPTLADIEQTLFLGCSVQNFSCNLGWNEQVSTLDINLVRDTCDSPDGTHKVYYDIVNYPNSPKREWTAADPGLRCFGVNNDEYPKLGAPCYFRFGDFEFCGLLQDWQRQSPQSDQEVYTVKLVSPVEILAGTQIIIGDYAGAVHGFNVLNAYGFQEYFSGKACPAWIDSRYPQDGVIFGSQAGGIGGSYTNEGGMPWYKIKEATAILSSSFIRSSTVGLDAFSQYGRICGKGGNENFKFGLLNPDFTNIELVSAFGISKNVAFYVLDLSELPVSLNDIRISGSSVSVLELLTEVTTQIGYDYYIELLPLNISGNIYKVIKVRTVSRTSQPVLGIVEEYISNVNEVIDSNYGREFRNESATNFIIGGQKQNIWQVENGVPDAGDDPDDAFFEANYPDNTYVRDRIVPFYGTDTEGNVYIEYTDDDDSYINLDLRSLKRHLGTLGPILPDTIRVDKTEILMSEGGFDKWTFYSAIAKTSIHEVLHGNGFSMPLVYNPAGFVDFEIDRMRVRDGMRLGKSLKFIDDSARKDLEKIWEFVREVYENYSNLMMVRLPNICAIQRDAEIILSDEIAEGGWTDASNILGLPNPGGLVDIFRNQDGTIRHIASYASVNGTGGFNSLLGTDQDPVLIVDDDIFMAANAINKIVFIDNENFISPRVIVESPKVLQDDSFDFMFSGWTRSYERLANLLLSEERITEIIGTDIESELFKFAAGPRIIEPSRIAIATKSNVETYGPWKPSNIIEGGPPGQITIDKDDSLVPWAYGSLTNLDNVAQARANIGVTIMDEAEVGSVEVAGIPDTPLGSELGSVRGLSEQYYNTNQNVIENRTFFVDNYNLTNPAGNSTAFSAFGITSSTWTGYYGPQVNSITYNFGYDKISTTYNFRTYSPKFGFISKLNADRISSRLKEQYTQQRILRLDRALYELQQNSKKKINKSVKKVNNSWHKKEGTPHSLLVGDISPWSSTDDTGNLNTEFSRTIIATKSIPEVLNNMGPTGTGIGDAAPFDKMAIMSWDGLIRPVSLFGDGDLPRFRNVLANPISNGDRSVPRSANPYLIITGTGGNDSYYHDEISAFYLNPFSNPSGIGSATSSIINHRHTGNCGHDIDIVARGVLDDYTGTGASLIMTTDASGYHSEFRADYANDYRPLALRGPIILHGWGYDLDGRPVPNQSDADAANGEFENYGHTNKFAEDFLRKPNLWPVGPLDVRYDRDRGVWTSPQQRRHEIAEYVRDPELLDRNYYRLVNNTDNLYDNNGNLITGDRIVEGNHINFRSTFGRPVMHNEKVALLYNTSEELYDIIAKDDIHTKLGMVTSIIGGDVSLPLECEFTDISGDLCCSDQGVVVSLGIAGDGETSSTTEDDCNGGVNFPNEGPGIVVAKNAHLYSEMRVGDPVMLISNSPIYPGVGTDCSGNATHINGCNGISIFAVHVDILTPLVSIPQEGVSTRKILAWDTDLVEEVGGEDGYRGLVWVDPSEGGGGMSVPPSGTYTPSGSTWILDYRMVRGPVNTDVEPGDGIVLDSVTPLCGGAVPVVPLNVLNTFGRTYYSGMRIHAAYNRETAQWHDLGYQTLILKGTVKYDVPYDDANNNWAQVFIVENIATLGGTETAGLPAELVVQNNLHREYKAGANVMIIYDEDPVTFEDFTAYWRDMTIIDADTVVIVPESGPIPGATVVPGGDITYGSDSVRLFDSEGARTNVDIVVKNISRAPISVFTPCIATKCLNGDYIVSNPTSNLDMIYFTTTAFDSTNKIITANVIKNLPTYTGPTSSPVKIFDKWGASWLSGEHGTAIYETGAFVNMTHGTVNWSTLREHRGRNFKINDRKETTDNPVTITWLDSTLADIAGAVEDIYDPHNKYAGRTNAKGIARLVSDPKNNTLRWEIEELESPAMVVCGVMDDDYNGGTPVDVTVGSFMGPEWAAGSPGSTVKAESCTYNDVKQGDSVTLYRKNPNSDPPLYTIISVEQSACTNPLTGARCELFVADGELQLDLTLQKCTGVDEIKLCQVELPCQDALVDITCDLDFYDGVLYQTLYLSDCTGGDRTEPCQTAIPIPYCENPLTGVTCSQVYDDETGDLTTTIYLLDCSGGMTSKECVVGLPTGLGGGCQNAITGISCDTSSAGIEISWHDCTGGTNSTTCEGTLIPVITGCDDPFVTFDSEGNPSWHFRYANIRVLGVDGGGTMSCDGFGITTCQ